MNWRKLSLALLGALAMLASVVSVSEAQDEDTEVEAPEQLEVQVDDSLAPGLAGGSPVVPDEPGPGDSLGGSAGFQDVIPGLETQGNGNTYVLLDSTDAGGPTFDTPAYDPTTLAPIVSAAGDRFEVVNVGFAFEYFGNAYATIGIADNGYLAFDVATNQSADNRDAASDLSTELDLPQAVILPLWTPLFPGDFGDIYYDTFGAAGSRVFVVEYRNVAYSGGAAGTTGVTFQVRLFEGSNAIEFHYEDVQFGNAGDFGGQAVVGLRDDGGPAAPYLQYSTNSPVIDNGLAIRLWQPICGGQMPTAVGDRGDDNFVGGAGVDIYYGHSGNDIMRGFNGNDILCGGPGEDSMAGGFGNDRMFGGGDDDAMFGEQGRDTMNGGVGNDRMFGQGADDVMEGGGGADAIRGGVGNDRLLGGTGPDLLFGNNGSDQAFGGPDNDIIRGQANPDILRGQGGNDLVIGGGGNDVHDGGPGVDTCVEGANQGLPETYVSCETQP